MARIVDKNTRILDIDFGQISVGMARPAGTFTPTPITAGQNGQSQLLNILPNTASGGGSFVQYVRLDLDFMTRNNEIVLPTESSIQRTSPVPLGYSNNGNNFDQIEEYIFILSRPLNNTNIAASTTLTNYEQFRKLGLDGSEGTSAVSGNAGWPTQAQTIYAEKRMYSYNENTAATIRNGELIDPTTLTPPAPKAYNTLMGMPNLDSVTSWGSMGAITGPNLHCYRVIINRAQSFPAIVGLFVNVDLLGDSSFLWPAVSVRFLCTDPKYSEGEYLTRLANAMNSIAEDGPTA